MNVEKALRDALEYEKRIRDIYREAAEASREDEARALYGFLGKDEESHVEFLRAALERWKREGRLDSPPTASGLPSSSWLEKASRRAASPLRDARDGQDQGGERNALERALAAEEETTAFYRKLAASLGEEAGRLFGRFLEIEEGHTRIVRAQLDLVSRTGYWFDVREFGQED